MIKTRLLLYLVALLPFFTSTAFGQDLEIGVFGGGSYYLGELNPGKQFYFTSPAYGIAGRYNYNTRWAGKLNFIMGKVAGDDAVSLVDTNRNLRFQSALTEISAQVEFNFFDYFIGSKRNFFTPYLFVGPGFFLFNPKAPYNGALVTLSNLQTENQPKAYKRYSFAAIFGLGFKYSINSRLALSLEWGMRKTYTDYLDDISTTYYVNFDNPSTTIDQNALMSDPASKKHSPGMQRGNAENNDWYSIAGVTLVYRFTIGEKSTCSDFEYSKNK